MSALTIEVVWEKGPTVKVEIDLEQPEHENFAETRALDADESYRGLGGLDLLSREAFISRLKEITIGRPDESIVKTFCLAGNFPLIFQYLEPYSGSPNKRVPVETP